jgi:hypothetical protein
VLAAGPQQLSTSPPSLLVSVTVAPAPTITGAVADQEITDKQTATLFSAITVADLNVNATGNPLADYVSVMLSNPSNGYTMCRLRTCKLRSSLLSDWIFGSRRHSLDGSAERPQPRSLAGIAILATA